MTPTAYLLINTEIGAEDEVIEKLRQKEDFDAVKEAAKAHGVYDIVAKIYTKTMDELGDIYNKIKGLEKVGHVHRLIVIAEDSFTRDKEGNPQDYEP